MNKQGGDRKLEDFLKALAKNGQQFGVRKWKSKAFEVLGSLVGSPPPAAAPPAWGNATGGPQH
jgi:hypothetical protein